ncbi:uroporphyrinogen decarboxylase family protein [Anaeromyxobacter paludicola]|uniref:Uroporphyrinogen decarboxylase n=1 Tax=Anaeromyxobacter paludicola TaxID=2918171 RepID=A0ABN6N715_9BACT|nr:uroporphyrinogen decarboxylase family protein [Anaeromyxobacter paludicola]BDG08826.1 uroporphyrinogen decarboxylase [Anaeromyxobacter paludicola]
MTGLERVLATLAGQPRDRHAFAPVLSLYGARLAGTPLPVHYRDAAAYARGQAAVREAFDPDVLFAPFSFAGLAEALGSELRFFDAQPPNVRRPALRDAHSWDPRALPDPDAHPSLLFLREAVRRMAAEHGREVPVAVALPPPADLPALAMGLEAWMDAVLFDRPRAEAILEDVIPFLARLANALFADGAALLVLPGGFTAQNVVTREIVEGFSRPALARALALLRGPAILHHVGAPLLGHLDLLTGLPAVAGYAIDERDSPERARAAIGPDPVLLTGPASTRLPGLAPAQAAAEVRALLASRRGDPRFLPCTTGADVPWDVEPAAIAAMSAEVARSGGVP